MKKTTIKGYFDLDYVVLVDVPVRPGKFGEVVTVNPEVIERRIAEEIIKQGVPLRGREIAFLRKSLGLSYERFAAMFDRNAATVFHWEKTPDKRLDSLLEAALRSLFAEHLGITLKGQFSVLRGEDATPTEITIHLTKAA